MKNNLFKSALAAAAATALFAQAAQAQIGYTNGDLILGVEATSGTGSSYDYEVNLGSITQFTAGNTIDFSNIVLNSDLSGTASTGGFGSGYATSANVYFGVVGTTTSDINDPTYTANAGNKIYKDALFITSTTDPGAQSYNAAISTSSSVVSPVGNDLGPLSPTTGGGEAAFVATTATGSYTLQEASTAGEDFNQNLTDGISMQAASAGGELELYLLNTAGDSSIGHTAINGVTGTDTALGYFTFESGDLIFNPATAPTPEPSTYALLMMGMGGLVWLVRRRSINS